ncbi:MAG: phosphoribosylformylglycinamidine synthase subunit PurQ [Desulfitobacteriia bacterium]
MRIGIVNFPGSDGTDCLLAWRLLGEEPVLLPPWETRIKDYDLLLLPGGFSYGDYLRPAALARYCPIVKEIIRFAREGGLVWGIGNGFQLLTEAGLLPGAFLPNKGLRFICSPQHLKVESNNSAFTNQYESGEIIQIPISHGQGNYYIDDQGLKELQDNKQIVFRYVTPEGKAGEEGNPNGSRDRIAGIINREGNILGMMPRPERVVEKLLGGLDGKKMFLSVQKYLERSTQYEA